VRTVQACVEEALSRIADHPLKAQCAGRTDAGVHALGQVIHIETHARREERAWVFGTNTLLPRDVSVLWAKPVADDFHARFSARRRAYRYVILNRASRPGLWASRVTWECRPLDPERMQTAANYLLGEHDFSAFRAQGCQAKSPVRTVHCLEVQRRGDRIEIVVEANAFLHHMVRNIAGVLMAVGRGEQRPDWAKAVLEGRDRSSGGVTAPPDGLYLTNVWYEKEHGLPENHVKSFVPCY
jgi:tRNA pseudouridine38-40 synthase